MPPDNTKPLQISGFTKAAVIIAAVWLVAVTIFTVHKTAALQLLTLPITLAFLLLICLSLVRPILYWRKESWQTLIPILTCIIAIFLSRHSGPGIRSYIFEKKLLPRYESIIQQINSGSIPVSTKGAYIPQAQDNWTLQVYATRSPNGDLNIRFLTDVGFPVRHSGYLYTSTGTIPQKDAYFNWPNAYQIKPHWFEFSD